MLFANQKFSIIKVRMSNINANANANNNNNQIDFGLLPKNIPSLCIPRVFPNISEARIRKTFQDISIGRIENIEMIKGEKFNRVFVHLIWANTPDANYVRNQVMTGKDVKIIYDEPWFWMVSASRKPMTQLSYKTDEFGRELRQPPPPTGPPPPPQQRQQRQQQQQPRQHHHQQPRQRQQQQQQPRQQHYHHHQAPPPPPPAPLQRQYAHGEYEPPLLTDEFGREIRKQAPPPPPTLPPIRVPVRTSWSSCDNDVDSDEEDKVKEEVKPRFIPQSPTSTPPSLRHKQIHPEEGAEVQVKAQQEEEEEEGTIKEEEDDDAVSQAPTEDEEGSMTKKETKSSKIDIDQPSTMTMVEIKYDFVIPVKKLRAKKTKKTVAPEPLTHSQIYISPPPSPLRVSDLS